MTTCYCGQHEVIFNPIPSDADDADSSIGSKVVNRRPEGGWAVCSPGCWTAMVGGR